MKPLADEVMQDMMVDTYTDNVDRILADETKFILPSVVTYKKEGQYFNII